LQRRHALPLDTLNAVAAALEVGARIAHPPPPPPPPSPRAPQAARAALSVGDFRRARIESLAEALRRELAVALRALARRDQPPQ
jgi:hypothetical protein